MKEKMEQARISHGFGPCIDEGSRTLILGSFPSVKSREAAFFYGHPQNRFWKVLELIFEDNIKPADSTESGPAGKILSSAAEPPASVQDAFNAANSEAAIAAKKDFLHRHHIALYDVIESCTITGSSDSSIRDVVPADIMGLLNAAPIERIFVNGKTAKKYYDKYLYPLCGQTAVCLPSTSPANAAWSLEKLAEKWEILVRPEIQYVDSTSNFYSDKDSRDGYLVWPDSGCGENTASAALDPKSDSTRSASLPLPLIRFHSLDDIGFVDASFTTRFGGVSRGVLGSLNLGFNRGDTEENLLTNWKRCAASMDCSLEQMIATDQVHGTEIIKAEEGQGLGTGLAPAAVSGLTAASAVRAGSPAEEGLLRPKVSGVDGFWCDTPGLTLCASFADCVPVYLVDPVGKRVSLAHSGWKGTVLQIAGKAVQILAGQGSRPQDIIAVIGPSISGAHYEVTEDVICAFRTGRISGSVGIQDMAGAEGTGLEAGNSLQYPDGHEVPYSDTELSDIYIQTDKRHFHLDLWAAIYYTLIHAGVRPENIHFSGICTWENADILWSHRRSGGKRGNMNAFLKIKD